MNEVAKAAKNAYMREYRAKNKEKYNAYQREWRQKNPEKVKECNERYWTKKAMS